MIFISINPFGFIVTILSRKFAGEEKAPYMIPYRTS